MTSLKYESTTLSSYLDLDEEVSYGSDTNVHGKKETVSNLPVPEVIPLSVPHPFVERGETNAPVAQHHGTDKGDKLSPTCSTSMKS